MSVKDKLRQANARIVELENMLENACDSKFGSNDSASHVEEIRCRYCSEVIRPNGVGDWLDFDDDDPELCLANMNGDRHEPEDQKEAPG